MNVTDKYAALKDHTIKYRETDNKSINTVISEHDKCYEGLSRVGGDFRKSSLGNFYERRKCVN